MGFQALIFGEGALNTTNQAIYTVPDGKAAYIKYFHVHNSGLIEDTFIAYVRASGSVDRIIARCNLLPEESADIFDTAPFVMTEGASLRGKTLVTASGMAYVICGGLES